MTITTTFDPPLPSDTPAVFDAKAFTLLGDLNDWSSEANALASDVNAKQATATTAATTASTAAGTATSAAATATTKASEAVNARDDAVDAQAAAEAAAAAAATFDPALYVAKAGGTMTGPLSVPGGASGAQVPRAQEVLLLAGDQTAAGNKSFTGNVLLTGSGSLGYGGGSGGVATQATSKSTPVTLNKPTGQITMNNAALAAGASVVFVLNTSAITLTSDLVVVNTPGSVSYRVEALNPFVGTVAIRVTNVTGGSLSEALVINFAVIKGALS